MLSGILKEKEEVFGGRKHGKNFGEILAKIFQNVIKISISRNFSDPPVIPFLKNSKASFMALARDQWVNLEHPIQFTVSTSLLIGYAHFGSLYTHPILLKPYTRQPAAAPVPQSPLELFKLASPNPPYLSLPIHSWGNHKNSHPQFLPCLFLFLQDQP